MWDKSGDMSRIFQALPWCTHYGILKLTHLMNYEQVGLIHPHSRHHLAQSLAEDGRLGVGTQPETIYDAGCYGDDVLERSTHLGTGLRMSKGYQE